MSRFGVHDGETRTLGLSDVAIATQDDLWDALSSRCQMPDWFGRDLDAWWDTIEAGGISEFIDEHEHLRLVLPSAVLSLADDYGLRFMSVTNECTYASAEVRPSATRDPVG